MKSGKNSNVHQLTYGYKMCYIHSMDKKKEWNTYTCNNMEEARSKITCMIPFIWNVQKRQIYREGKQFNGCLEWGVGVGIANIIQDLFGVMEMFLNSIVLMVSQFYKFTKNHWIVYSKWVNFVAYKLFINKPVFLKSQSRHGSYPWDARCLAFSWGDRQICKCNVLS